MRPKAARQHAAGAAGRSEAALGRAGGRAPRATSHAPTKARAVGWLQHLVCNIEQTERVNPVTNFWGGLS